MGDGDALESQDKDLQETMEAGFSISKLGPNFCSSLSKPTDWVYQRKYSKRGIFEPPNF